MSFLGCPLSMLPNRGQLCGVAVCWFISSSLVLMMRAVLYALFVSFTVAAILERSPRPPSECPKALYHEEKSYFVLKDYSIISRPFGAYRAVDHALFPLTVPFLTYSILDYFNPTSKFFLNWSSIVVCTPAIYSDVLEAIQWSHFVQPAHFWSLASPSSTSETVEWSCFSSHIRRREWVYLCTWCICAWCYGKHELDSEFYT